MDPRFQELINYCAYCLQSGMSPDMLRQQLAASGWDAGSIDAALRYVMPGVGVHSANPHRVRDGVLWIVSPFIVLVGAALLEFFFHAVGMRSPLLNIITLLAGLAGVVLLFVGPILGIIKLTRR